MNAPAVKKTVHLFSILTGIGILSQVATAESLSFIGPISKTAVKFTIYTPDGYGDSTNRYPVLYFCHGITGSHLAGGRVWTNHVSKAISRGILEPCVFVAVDGFSDGMYADCYSGNKPVETTVIRELIPYVDQHFRTIADRRQRAIFGHSMGGFGAMEYAAKFPELFCCAVSIDGAMHTWKTFSASHADLAKSNFNNDEACWDWYSPYANMGKHKNTIQQHNVGLRLVVGKLVKYNQTFRDHLLSLGIPFEYEETGASHDMSDNLAREKRSSFAFISEQFQKYKASTRTAPR